MMTALTDMRNRPMAIQRGLLALHRWPTNKLAIPTVKLKAMQRPPMCVL